MGYDKPQSLGDSATAGLYTAPIFRDFMTEALKGKPDVKFRVPEQMKLLRVSRSTGQRVGPGEDAILEAFKPGTGPPDSASMPGASTAPSARRGGGSPDRAISSGTGGLY
jgi:penicillin-binding protein 1A